MIYYKDLEISTKENNLTDLDAKLSKFTEKFDFFHMEDITDAAQEFVESHHKDNQVKDGLFTAQVLHTTCILNINELHEPMLVGDMNNHVRDFVPKVKDYLHNSPLRTANRCEDDYKCDRNADAHLKSFLIGNTTASLFVRDGKLLLGEWQRLGLVDFDGPRTRKVVFQLIAN